MGTIRHATLTSELGSAKVSAAQWDEDHDIELAIGDITGLQVEIDALNATSFETARTITATAEPLGTDATLLVDASGGAVTVNLPTAFEANKRILTVKKIDSGSQAVIIDPDGSETIDRQTTVRITKPFTSLRIQSDGTEWWIV